MKQVLDVGQCSFDHAAIRALVEDAFDARVTQAHDADGALEALRAGTFDLVLVNRKFDSDGSDGLALIQEIKADRALSAVRVILVSNYPESQAQALAAGAEPGFGKAQLGAPQTRERLAAVLG